MGVPEGAVDSDSQKGELDRSRNEEDWMRRREWKQSPIGIVGAECVSQNEEAKA